METLETPTKRIETLRALLDRLCSPDLTLGEAKHLRDQLFNTMRNDERPTETNPRVSEPSSSDPESQEEGAWSDKVSPNFRLCTAC